MHVFSRPLRRTFYSPVSPPISTHATAPAAIVHGTVTDPLGAAVVGANVALVQNGKVVTNTHTDSAGGFTSSCGHGRPLPGNRRRAFLSSGDHPDLLRGQARQRPAGCRP